MTSEGVTSQRDETVGHVAGDEMTDDPIIVERRDEILGGRPVDDTEADDPAGRDETADDGTPAGYTRGGTAADGTAADGTAADGMSGDELAGDGLDTGEPAGDELTGRHAAPDTRGTGPEDVPPLVVPETAPAGDFAGSGPAPGAVADPVPGAAASPVPGTAQETGPAQAADTAQATSAVQAADTAGATAGAPAAALAGQQWPAIQALFVDDPKGSVQRAAAAADEEVKAFVASLQREQEALRASWASDASTEDLRTALQQYRAFCGRLEGLA